jgi:hypothetical protein
VRGLSSLTLDVASGAPLPGSGSPDLRRSSEIFQRLAISRLSSKFSKRFALESYDRHGQADITLLSIVTKNTNYALREDNLRADDTPPGVGPLGVSL